MAKASPNTVKTTPAQARYVLVFVRQFGKNATSTGSAPITATAGANQSETATRVCIGTESVASGG